MPEPDSVNLFVYGTLLSPKPDADPADIFNFNKIAIFLKNIIPARLKGAVLYDFGSFPGAFRGEGTIRGEVLQLDGRALEVLDPLEGHPDMYYREIVEVETDSGPMQAWIYWAPDDLRPMGSPILNGDWLRRNA